MKTAIITGASAGLGTDFALQLHDVFPEIDHVVLIARRMDRLEAVAGKMTGVQVECLPLDLCEEESFSELESFLNEKKLDVALLINCAGCGDMGNFGEIDTAKQMRIVDLNVRALTAATNVVIPFMKQGAHILNISSIASFCANPRMTTYSASKAYVSSFTLGISEELKEKGITATAICPGPMRTEFLELASIHDSFAFNHLPYCDSRKVALQGLKAAKAGKVFVTPRAFFKFYRVLAKILPSTWMVKLTKT